MPPRLRLPSHGSPLRYALPRQQCRYASLAAAPVVTPAPPVHQTVRAAAPVQFYPPTQPPSHKPPEFRKSQLFRQYASLLHSTPLMLIFQHNNLRSIEWMGIRRELTQALRKVDERLAADGRLDAISADNIRVQTVQTGIFAAALNVVEFFRPENQPQASAPHPSDPATRTSAIIPETSADSDDPRLTHALSRAANKVAQKKKRTKKHGLEPLLSGPLAVVTFPNVSPAHVAAVLSILSPNKEFAAPKRRTNPGLYEPSVQLGLHKLMLLGARVEGKVFDGEGTRWVGGIEGGIDGLRAQLVAMLQGFGAGLTTTLESASRNLWITVEGRRSMLEEEQKPKEAESEQSA